jgi:hypothetical protein
MMVDYQTTLHPGQEGMLEQALDDLVKFEKNGLHIEKADTVGTPLAFWWAEELPSYKIRAV